MKQVRGGDTQLVVQVGKKVSGVRARKRHRRPPDTKRIRELETGNRGIGKSDCVTGRITSTRPVHNHLLPTPRLTVSYLTIQYQTTFLWMGFCEI